MHSSSALTNKVASEINNLAPPLLMSLYIYTRLCNPLLLAIAKFIKLLMKVVVSTTKYKLIKELVLTYADCAPCGNKWNRMNTRVS